GYSWSQAKAITEVIDCAIGMNAAINDRAAIIFIASFYRAIGFGRSIKEAFDQGKVALLLEGVRNEHIPELLVRRGVDPSKVILANMQTINDSYVEGRPLFFESFDGNVEQWKKTGDCNQCLFENGMLRVDRTPTEIRIPNSILYRNFVFEVKV